MVDPERYGRGAVELAAIAGVVLDGWQVDLLVESMLVDGADDWLFPLVCIAVSRQDGKGEVLQARELYGSIRLAELIGHTAQILSTSKDAFKRAHRTISSSPLEAYMSNDRWANGEESLEFGSDVQAINYRARSGKGLRGLTQIDFIAYDEAQHLLDDHVSAASPTQLVSPHPQTFALGSGGLATSEKWWEWRVQGLVAADGGRGEPMTGLIVGRIPGEMLWVEYTAEEITVRGDGVIDIVRPDIDDEAALARANPAYPHRVTPKGLAKMRRELGDDGFMRECMGCWDPLPSKGGPQSRLTLLGWGQGEDDESAIVSGLVLGVAVSGDRVCVAAGGRRGDGSRHVETVRAGDGAGWLTVKDAGGVSWLERRLIKNDAQRLVFDGSGGSRSLKADLKAAADGAGVELVCLSGTDYAAACQAFADAHPDVTPATGREVFHLAEPSVVKAIKQATLLKAGSGFRWGCPASSEIAALEAVTVVDWVAKQVPAAESAYVDRGLMTV